MKTWWPTPWISWNPHHWCLWVILELTVRFQFARKLIPLVWSVAAASVECSAPVKKLGVLVYVFHHSCIMIAWLNLMIKAWWGSDNLSAEWCDTIILYVSWVLANMMTESPITQNLRQKLRTQILYNGLAQILGGLLHTCLHPSLWADEVNW